MKRALALMGVVLVLGAVGMAQCCPPPPPPKEPPCYTTFWVGEGVYFKVDQFWSIFCCCCCGPQDLVVGWRIEAFTGGVVYTVTLPAPAHLGTEFLWKGTDALGNPVAPGFYKIVVTLSSGKIVDTHVKLVAQTSGCCNPCLPISIPCLTPLCGPYIKVWRAPCTTPCVTPSGCCLPFLFFLGCCGG